MFKKIPANIQWNGRKDSGEKIILKILENAEEDLGEDSKRFWRMLEKISENVQIDSGECIRVFRGSNVFTFKLIKATSFLKWPPAPASSASKCNSKFEILLAKISLK